MVQRGQIAHLDRDHGNNSEDNLAYFCMRHHAIYDEESPSSKRMTPDEARWYRDELYEHNKVYFNLQDPDEETEIVVFALGKEDKAVSFQSLRRHVTLIICSDTRPAETRRQLDELIRIGVLSKSASGEYSANKTTLEELRTKNEIDTDEPSN